MEYDVGVIDTYNKWKEAHNRIVELRGCFRETRGMNATEKYDFCNGNGWIEEMSSLLSNMNNATVNDVMICEFLTEGYFSSYIAIEDTLDVVQFANRNLKNNVYIWRLIDHFTTERPAWASLNDDLASHFYLTGPICIEQTRHQSQGFVSYSYRNYKYGHIEGFFKLVEPFILYEENDITTILVDNLGDAV